MDIDKIFAVGKVASEMPLEMKIILDNPLTDKQGIEYLNRLRSIGEIHAWRRPRIDHAGAIMFHELFLKCWSKDAAAAAQTLALIHEEHPANQLLRRKTDTSK